MNADERVTDLMGALYDAVEAAKNDRSEVTPTCPAVHHRGGWCRCEPDDHVPGCEFVGCDLPERVLCPRGEHDWVLDEPSGDMVCAKCGVA